VQARRQATAFALLSYVDLNGFKKINHRHGHAAADETLTAARQPAGGCVRGIDPDTHIVNSCRALLV
jgi:GGDEF domain-containing protein